MNHLIFEQSENPSKRSRIAGQVRSRASLTFQCLLLLITALAPLTSRANPPVLVAADGTFLGVASANPYDLDSISNPFGLYGSEYSANSINNPYGIYGSEFSTESTTNPFFVSEPLEK